MQKLRIWFGNEPYLSGCRQERTPGPLPLKQRDIAQKRGKENIP